MQSEIICVPLAVYTCCKSFTFSPDSRVDGPFRLEIHKIGVYKTAPWMSEDFRYETYYFPYPNFDKN